MDREPRTPSLPSPSDLRLLSEHLSRERVEIDPALTQHDQPMMSLQHGTVGPRLQRPGLPRAKRFDEVRGRQNAEALELHVAQNGLRMQETERRFGHGHLSGDDSALL